MAITKLPSEPRDVIERCRYKRLGRLLTWTVGIAIAGGTQAGDWLIEPELIVQGTYTDNLFLTSTNEESDFVGQISPGVSITGQGRRLVAFLRYRMQGLVYLDNDEYSEINHQLASNATAELVKQRFFVDASATFSQQNQTNFGARARDNLNPVNDRNDVTTYLVSPYWVERWGSFANSEVRFTYDRVETDGQDNNSSDELLFRAQLESGPQFNTWLWNVYTEASEIEFDTGEKVEFREVVGQVRYVINHAFSVFANVGYEDDDFITIGNQDTSGERYDLGVTWTPNPRTFLEASIGDRYFGSVATVEARYRRRRMQFFAQYQEEAELPRARQLAAGNFAVAAVPGDFVVDPVTGETVLLDFVDPATGEPVPLDDLPTLNQQVYVSKTFTGGATYNGRRTIVDMRFFTANRDIGVAGDGGEDVTGIAGVWTHRMTRLMTAVASVDWRNVDGQARTEDTVGFYLGLNRRLGKQLEAVVNFQRIERYSDNPLNEYSENRIGVGIRMTF